jgi:hypothetical protein
MSKFFNGSGVSSVLTDIITNADEELCIVSPYLKIPIQTKNYLKTTDKKNIPITIVYRTDSSLNEDDLRFFNELNHLDLLHCDNLHSKCYINEKEGLITSMNLHEHSQVTNWEMGIKFSKQSDLEIYTDVVKELNYLLSSSQPHTLKQKAQGTKQNDQSNYPSKSSQKIVYKPKEAPKKSLFSKVLDSVLGEEAYCIRCGHSVDKFNLEMPLCERHYQIWAKYKDIKYKEKFCHACGKPKPNISFEKPTCRVCFDDLYKKPKF